MNVFILFLFSVVQQGTLLGMESPQSLERVPPSLKILCVQCIESDDFKDYRALLSKELPNQILLLNFLLVGNLRLIKLLVAIVQEYKRCI